jgi:hypothetical protein
MAIKDLKDEIEGLKRDLNLSTDALAGALKVDSRTVRTVADRRFVSPARGS